MKHAFAAGLLLVAVVCLNAAQKTQLQESGTMPSKLKSFLETSQELRHYSKLGYTSNFTGALRPIPAQLQSQLSNEFPQYKFHIAKMSVLISRASSYNKGRCNPSSPMTWTMATSSTAPRKSSA